MLRESIKVGDKVEVIKTVSTVDGTLYKETVVKVTGIGYPDKDIEVRDPLGKLWYLDYEDVTSNERKDK